MTNEADHDTSVRNIFEKTTSSNVTNGYILVASMSSDNRCQDFCAIGTELGEERSRSIPTDA
jgi:hypothetical protein